MSATLETVLEFLANLYHQKKAVNTINVHRSMLSETLPAVGGYKVGSHPLVKDLLSGCYNVNPPKPKSTSTWDPSRVLFLFDSMEENGSLSLSELSHKTVTLIALTSLFRVSEIASINLNSLIFSSSGIHLSLLRPRKAQHSGPLQSIFIARFSCLKRCPVAALEDYVNRTSQLRIENRMDSPLFIALIVPHAPVTANTISRWIKTVLRLAGIDTSVFSAHSTRGAAASSAAAKGISVDAILKAGSWARESTFNRFYRKQVLETSVASAVLGEPVG